MAAFSIWHWLLVMMILLVLPIVMIIPMWRLLPRAGIPAPIAILSIIPFALIVLLWIMAFKRWPEDR